MDGLLQDLRYATRSLRKSPAFTTVAVLTLALGIGATTAVFTVADALLAHPLRGIDGERLVVVAIGQKAPAAPADYFDWRRLTGSFEELAAYRLHESNLAADGGAVRVHAVDITGNFFATLQATPAFGRTPVAADDETAVAVLSYGFWQQYFGADPQILGRGLDIDGSPHTIVGVMRREFEVPVPADVWLPLTLSAAERGRRDLLTLHVVGRLKPSTTLGDAQSEMAGIAGQLERAYPATNANRRAHVLPLAEFVQGTLTRAGIFLLLGAVHVVLLIACVNLAGLQLARTAMRRRELAVRTALGANPWRIARLVLVENVVAAAIGGALSVAIAVLCVDSLLRSMPGDVARLVPGFTQIRVGWRALGFTVVVSAVTAMIAAVAPAVRSARAQPIEPLKESRLHGASRQRLRGAFVAGQLAVAFVLLVSSAVFVNGLRGLLSLQDVHDPKHVLVFKVTLPQAQYPDAESRQGFYRVALNRLTALPGVRRAAAFSAIPLSNNGVTWSEIEVEGHTRTGPPRQGAIVQHVSPDYFPLLHVPLRNGRLLDDGDRPAGLPAAVISEAMARRYWPRDTAIGKRIRIGLSERPSWTVVVGVVGDVLYDWTNRVAEPAVYLPISQAPAKASQFALRVDGDTTPFVSEAKAQIAASNPRVPAFDIMSLSDAIRDSLSGNSQMAAMMAMLAALALLIAVVGLYGVIAYLVAARTREFGVRMALGAGRRDIFRMVMGRGLRLAIAGLGGGVALALAATRLMRGLVFGASENERVIWCAVAAVLTAIALLASYVPARRATHGDPMIAIRMD